MSGRWFFSHARQGVATAVSATLTPEVTFTRSIGGGDPGAITVAGPRLRLTSADDVVAIDRGLVWREEPPAGTPAAAEHVLASVEFAHADLPWLLSTRAVRPPGGGDDQPLPWLVLLVVSTDEADPPRDADPAPLLTVPVAALPPLDESWAWAHIEARVPDGADHAAATAAVGAALRTRSGSVVSRLLCPRRLTPDTDWIAAVVPVPSSGAWPAPEGGAGTIEVRVVHWWRFSTGQGGSFEDLARRLKRVDPRALGLGSRTVDVSAPFPGGATAAEPAPSPITVTVDGALRPLGPLDVESWSSPDAQAAFRARLTTLLNTPALRRATPTAGEPVDVGPDDRDEQAVGPPIYGSHHSGEQTVDEAAGGWLTTLNLEVRRRVAASLGARYVQVEQEFLMARAWEQVGEIREANRALAAAELAAVAAEGCRRKHVEPQAPIDLVTTMAPLATRVTLPPSFMHTVARDEGVQGLAPDGTSTLTVDGSPAVDRPSTLAAVLETSEVPDGMVTTAYSRLTRRRGALARRADRMAGTATPQSSAFADKLPMTARPLPGVAAGDEPMGLVDELAKRTDPLTLQLRRMADVIGADALAARGVASPRPLAPIMQHPRFGIAIGDELLARWPEWAVPGIGAIPDESVVVLETNPGFVSALLVGLNHEFNRELLWREFPTDQRGTPFTRFWPTPGADVDEIARWPLDTELGSQIAGGSSGSIVLVLRGEVLRRFPGASLIAIKGELVGEAGPDGEPRVRVPESSAGGTHGLPMPLDDSTVLFLFPGLSEELAVDDDWFFVLREPMRATQFGFDLQVREPDGSPASNQERMSSWADLTWQRLTLDGGRFVRVHPAPPAPSPEPGATPPADPARWGTESADMARIAFQQPFQLAFRARAWLAR